jgi:deoxyribodipyrimidine photo-lyase
MMIEDRIISKIEKNASPGGACLYWMNRDMRVQDNVALIYASQIAIENKVPLIVYYNFIKGFLGGNPRLAQFKIEGLKEVEKNLKDKNIPFFVNFDDEKDTADSLCAFIEKNKIGNVVTDFSPLHLQRKIFDKVSKRANANFIQIDAHNIIPVNILSDKQEFAAYTIRPKVYKSIHKYLLSFDKIKNQKESILSPDIKWEKIEKELNINAIEPYDFRGGESVALRLAREFIKEKIVFYHNKRNDPNARAVSGMSPYLHYGMVSPARLVFMMMEYHKCNLGDLLGKSEEGGGDLENSLKSFFEELVVRRELAENFCFYNKNYDSVDGFPAWSLKSHSVHRKDKRDFVYTKKQFEKAETHDDLWNACQNEMIQTGKMHGYMRMYWAKKILEWTKSPEDAMDIAIYLNDKYEIDGRDPNGYTGIAWSIGGVHDRAWFTRPVYGQIRYMARSGCDKKFNTKEYIKKYTTQDNNLFDL